MVNHAGRSAFVDRTWARREPPDLKQDNGKMDRRVTYGGCGGIPTREMEKSEFRKMMAPNDRRDEQKLRGRKTAGGPISGNPIPMFEPPGAVRCCSEPLELTNFAAWPGLSPDPLRRRDQGDVDQVLGEAIGRPLPTPSWLLI